MKKQEEESGRLRFLNGVIHYEFRGEDLWQLPLSEVVIIGEYTTEHGPFADDWFLVFMMREQKWYEASVYARGREKFFNELSNALNAEIQPALCSHTDYFSRTIWPQELKDKSLFDFREVKGSGILRKLKLAVLPEVQFCLSESTEQYLAMVSSKNFESNTGKHSPEKM